MCSGPSATADAASLAASSLVCRSTPWIRSSETLRNPAARAVSNARTASPPLCLRPRATSCAGANDCTPIESRLTPSSRNAANRSSSVVPGFASRVTSAPTRIDQSVERVRDARLLAEQERTTALLQAILPDGRDAVHLRLRLRPQRLVRILLDDLHRAVVAQVGEARMHLRRQRPRAGPLGRVLRPETLVREL